MEHGKYVSWECRSSARETPIFLLFWIMENGPQIRTQLAEKRLKLDSSSLAYEVAPTGPRPAQCVSRCSRTASATAAHSWPTSTFTCRVLSAFKRIA